MLNTHWKWRRTAASLLMTPLLVLTVGQGPAEAAAKCYDKGCKGKDPQTQGCARRARTVWEITSLSVRIELRVSDACRAAWVRATNHQSISILGEEGAIVGYSCPVNRCLKGDYRTPFLFENDQGWSRMWPNSEWIRACKVWEDFDSGPPRTYADCTPFT